MDASRNKNKYADIRRCFDETMLTCLEAGFGEFSVTLETIKKGNLRVRIRRGPIEQFVLEKDEVIKELKRSN